LFFCNDSIRGTKAQMLVSDLTRDAW
jgi:hypothetical protein